MNNYFSILIQKIKKNGLIAIITFVMISPALFAAEVKKDEAQKKDAEAAVQKPAEVNPESAEKTTDVKKSETPNEQKKTPASLYFYPSKTVQDSSGNDFVSPQTQISEPGNGFSDDSSENRVAYVPLAPISPTAPTPDRPPDMPLPPGVEKGTAGSNLDEWLSKHPDVKDRMHKQQQMMNAQIKDNQTKVAGEIKSSTASREDGSLPDEGKN